VRVLVTGSRVFSSRTVIRRALDVINEQPGPHTLVHGDAQGADRMAAAYARELGWTLEPHPADWQAPCTEQCQHRRPRVVGTRSDFCPTAGVRRNALMVELGADVCVAFYSTAAGVKNVGTTDCVKRAGKARIVIQRFTDNGEVAE
jgi:hypothetical protein